MRRTVYMLAACLCLLSACAEDDGTTERRQIELDESPPSTTPFVHPLQGGPLDGSVPLVHDAQVAVGEEGVVYEEGGSDTFIGIKRWSARTLTAEERAAERTAKGPRPSVVHSYDKVNAMLADWRASGSQEARTLDLAVALPANYISRNVRDETEIARRQITTREDYRQVREENLEAHRQQVSARVSEAAGLVRSIGGTVHYKCKNIYCLKAALNPAQVESLASSALIASIDPPPRMHGNAITGEEVTNGHQMKLFADDNYLGDPSWSPMTVAVLEHQRLFTGHYGFFDFNNSTSSRIAQLRECNTFSSLLACVTRSSWSSSQAGSHATKVTGLVAGDLTDGQDIIASDLWEREYSGYGREAEIKFWYAPGDQHIILALDDIAGNTDVHMLNMSIADDINTDATCAGTNTVSRAINDLFDAGILTFFAAGNEYVTGTTPSSDCTVESPGAAIGAFVVGATLSNALVTTGTETDVRDGNLRSSTDQGGTWSKGQNRDIIDLVATGIRKWTFMTSMSAGSGGYDTNVFGGTSAAAPTVTGAALQLADFYTVNSSSAIDNPGILHAHMLLSGDRTVGMSGSTSIKATVNGHNRWGAGRMKMRRYDEVGLDGPASWGSWSICIGDGGVYYQPLNSGNPISTDTDALKAVIYWYDRRHENGTAIDDIDLRLERKVNGVWTTARSSATYSKDWERVYWSDFSGGHEYRLRVYGDSVTSDSAGCGTNKMRVRIVWLHEDSDRESWENLAGIVEVE